MHVHYQYPISWGIYWLSTSGCHYQYIQNIGEYVDNGHSPRILLVHVHIVYMLSVIHAHIQNGSTVDSTQLYFYSVLNNTFILMIGVRFGFFNPIESVFKYFFCTNRRSFFFWLIKVDMMLQVVEVLNIHCISRNGQQLYIMCMGLSLDQTNTDFTKTQRVAKGIFDPSDNRSFLLSAQRLKPMDRM